MKNIKCIQPPKEVLDRINAVPIYAPAPAPKPKESETYRVLMYHDYEGWDTIFDQDKTKEECEAYINKQIAHNPYGRYMLVKIEGYYSYGNDYVGEELEEKLSKEGI